MKNPSYFLISLLCLCSVFSCKNDEIGNTLQPEQDKIIVEADTFHLSVTSYDELAVIPLKIRYDTLLLGAYQDQTFGSTYAEILAQVNCPINYEFPKREDITNESLRLSIYYKGITGYTKTPFKLKVYRMTEKLIYSESYNSGIDIEHYCDKTELLGETPTPISLDTETGVININLNKKLLDELMNAPASAYASSDAFTDFFKGLYLTTEEYGLSTMLYVYKINMQLTYEYPSPTGTDSKIEVAVNYPASKEVRQVNHIETANTIVTHDSVQHIQVPAATLAKITVPLQRMREQMSEKISGKKMNVNSALTNIEVAAIDTTQFTPPPHMLMIKETEFKKFFEENRIHDGITSILGEYNSSSNSYTFNLSSYLSQEFKNGTEEDEMVLAPVSAIYGSNGIQSVDHALKLRAMTIRTGKNPHSPLRVSVVYSGF